MNYLYNGVELPALPEWDKTLYPYAVIGATANGGAAEGGTNWLYVCSMRPYQNSSGKVVLGNADAQCRHAHYYGNGISTDWGTLQNSGIRTVTSEYNVWTNTDILHEDGSVYLAASEPVPVLSIDYTAMIQGWIVGKRLAAQRRKKLPGDITDATFENGILYIKNASAVLNGSILEVK